MKGKNMCRNSFFLVSCIYCFILSVQRCSGDNSLYERCVPSSCDKGPRIKFPFYIHGSLQEPFCGLFGIRCGNNGFPMIRLSDNDYVIGKISYENRSFLVHNAAVDTLGRSCTLDFRNVTPPAPSMNIISTSSLHLLSRCKNVSEKLEKYKVACDNESEDGWELAMLGNDENLSSAIRQCGIDVVAPVELQGDEGRNGVVDFEGLLRKGFALNWTSRDCIRCEQSGGHCGIKPETNGFRCYCSYGFEYTVCKSNGGR